MTATATDLTRATQQQVVDGIRQSQQAMLENFKTWSQAVGSAVPAAATALPSAPGTPSPQELVDATFDFVESLVAGQREFLHELIGASAAAEATPAPKASTKDAS